MEITTPSGLSGEVRELMGSDGRFLTNLRVSRANLIPDYILKACWLSTTAPGIYSLKPGESGPDWSKALVGDRDYTLVQIAIESYYSEDPYTFRARCKSVPCREAFEWDIDLRKLPVKKLGKADRETYLSGNRFHANAGGRDIIFKLVNGADVHLASAARKEARARQRGNDDEKTNLLVEAILMRLVEVQGIDEKHHAKRRREAFLNFLEGLPMRVLAKLLDAFDQHDCGIETTIEVVCPECDEPQEVELPFAGDFFFPRTSKVVGSTIRRRRPAQETEALGEEEEEEKPAAAE